jgi:hypothetical protein
VIPLGGAIVTAPSLRRTARVWAAADDLTRAFLRGAALAIQRHETPEPVSPEDHWRLALGIAHGSDLGTAGAA